MNIYLFIWLCQVFVAVRGIFNCSVVTLNFGMWDLVPLTRDRTWDPYVRNAES